MVIIEFDYQGIKYIADTDKKVVKAITSETESVYSDDFSIQAPPGEKLIELAWTNPEEFVRYFGRKKVITVETKNMTKIHETIVTSFFKTPVFREWNNLLFIKIRSYPYEYACKADDYIILADKEFEDLFIVFGDDYKIHVEKEIKQDFIKNILPSLKKLARKGYLSHHGQNFRGLMKPTRNDLFTVATSPGKSKLPLSPIVISHHDARVEIATARGLFIHKTSIKNIEHIFDKPDSVIEEVRFPSPIPGVVDIYVSNSTIVYKLSNGNKIAYIPSKHKFRVTIADKHYYYEFEKLETAIRKAAKPLNKQNWTSPQKITQTITTPPDCVDANKIITAAIKLGAIYSPFYTIKAKKVDQNMWNIFIKRPTDKMSFNTLVKVYDNENVKFTKEIDKELIKTIVTGRFTSKLIELFGDHEQIKYKNVILTNNGTLEGVILSTPAGIFTPDYFTYNNKEKDATYVCPVNGGNIEITRYSDKTVSLNYTGKPLLIATLSVKTAIDSLKKIRKLGIDNYFKKLAPGIPLKYVESIRSSSPTMKTYEIKFEAGKKCGVLRAEVKNNGIKYTPVPYRDGIYNVHVPPDFEGDIMTLETSDGVPQEVKTIPKQKINYCLLKNFRKIYSTTNTIKIYMEEYTVSYENGKYFVTIDGTKYAIDEIIAYKLLDEQPPKEEVKIILSALL